MDAAMRYGFESAWFKRNKAADGMNLPPQVI
jgi:hypothetical protein